MERFNVDLELVPGNIMEFFSDIDHKCYVWQTLFLTIFNEHFPVRRKRIRQSTLWRGVTRYWQSDIDDEELTGHKDIADAMNSYFTSIASSLSWNYNKVECEFVRDEALPNIESFRFTILDENEVSKAIKDINQAKAIGPDVKPSESLKNAHRLISPKSHSSS